MLTQVSSLRMVGRRRNHLLHTPGNTYPGWFQQIEPCRFSVALKPVPPGQLKGDLEPLFLLWGVLSPSHLHLRSVNSGQHHQLEVWHQLRKSESEQVSPTSPLRSQQVFENSPRAEPLVDHLVSLVFLPFSGQAGRRWQLSPVSQSCFSLVAPTRLASKRSCKHFPTEQPHT